jgi:aldehyde dehydrogenase (NAD+)
MPDLHHDPTEGYVHGRRGPVGPAEVESAVVGVEAAFAATRRLSSFDRAAILDKVAAALAADPDDLARRLTAESGYLTHRDMLLEVQRSVEVFVHAAATARLGTTDALTLDSVARARNAFGLVRREPIGPALGITAFNGPLLIAAHKVAPAVVAGAPIVLKPSPRVPASAVLLAEHVVRAGWPANAIAVLPVADELTQTLIRDSRLPVVSFTGGVFGWTIKDLAPRKHVHLELGGVGAVIVADDADLETAAQECTTGGFVRSGQACISVQRIYVQAGVYERFVELLAKKVSALTVGDPTDPATDIGPLVDEAAAVRVEEMIADAVARGARVCLGGTRNGVTVEPTVLADVTAEMAILRREAFGPVVAVAKVDTLAEAVGEANATDGAILAGLYTSNIDLALTMADELRAGGVIINGPTAWRVDHMPYGGVGASGFGREGIRAMVDEYTQAKTVVVRHSPKDLEVPR